MTEKTNAYLAQMINQINNLSLSTDVIKSKIDVCFSCRINGEYFFFYDAATSTSVNAIAWEIENHQEYNFSSLSFNEGDVIIDVGACVGMVSIYLAKKFPQVKIIAIEPSARNYANLVKNVEINQCRNITTVNCAVSSDREKSFVIKTFLRSTSNSQCELSKGKLDQFNVMPYLDPSINSVATYNFIDMNVAISMTLEDICKKYEVNKIRMIKMDCEGAEHDILPNSQSVLKNTEHLRMELHGSAQKCNETLESVFQCMPKEKVLYNLCITE